jgi:hypothetical protein
MATKERRKERYRTDEDYRQRRLRQVQERRAALRLQRDKEKRLRGWSDISSVPDNLAVLIYDPDIFWPVVAILEDGHWRCIHYQGPEPRPTHWRHILETPLP